MKNCNCTNDQSIQLADWDELWKSKEYLKFFLYISFGIKYCKEHHNRFKIL